MSPIVPFLILIAAISAAQIAVWLYRHFNPISGVEKRNHVIGEIAAKLRSQGVENYRAVANVQFNAMVDRRRFIEWARQEYLSRDVTLAELKDEYLAANGKTLGMASGMLYGKPLGIMHTKTACGEIQNLTDAEVFASGPCREKYEAETAEMMKRLAEWNRRVSRDRTAEIVTEELYMGRGRL